MVVTVNFHQPDIAQLAGLDNLIPRFHQMRRTAALRAHLHHAIVLASRRQHGFAFRNIHADRLLAVNIRPTLHRGDHGQRVPVIRRGNLDYVKIFLFQHLAIIRIYTRPLFRCLPRGNHIGALVQHVAIDITQRHHFYRSHLQQANQVRFAIPAAADQADS